MTQRPDGPLGEAPLTIHVRDVPPRVAWALEQAGVHPLLARLYAARGLASADDLDDGLARLHPPAGLHGAAAAAELLADALEAGSRIVVVADYDCNGATACATFLRGLALFGAAPESLAYVVPDRRKHGYGLTPAIVDLALAHEPDVLVTVDNGIASFEGIAHAQAEGVAVVVTDHHLPARVDGEIVLPPADVIVNPNQPGCAFASKSLSGVGVAFYVLLALRAELRARGAFGEPGARAQRPQGAWGPALDTLLDLVALGTVADVVPLDANNRRLVAQGLARMRAGRMQPGVAALLAVAGRDAREASGFDLGFAVGPRLNAAGRLADMTLGIETLLTDDPARAGELAALLDGINRERRTVEDGMREQALSTLAAAHDGAHDAAPADAVTVVFDESFHEGVVGIVASRLKDRWHRPTFVFARGEDGLLKGSGRSVEGFHLRDALDLASKREPALLRRFGGHAMAAGCTIAAADLDLFRTALSSIARESLGEAGAERRLASDGALGAEHFVPASARLLERQVWGPRFEAPVFSDRAEIVSQRLVGEKHLKLAVRVAGGGAVTREAIWFNRVETLPERCTLAFRLSVDAWQGQERVQLVVVGMAD